MILVSRNIRYIRDIREGSLGRGVKRLWVVEEPPICLCPCIVESVFSVGLLVTYRPRRIPVAGTPNYDLKMLFIARWALRRRAHCTDP